MRRALKDVVPAEILERKRKAYVIRGPLTALQAAGDQVKALLDNPSVVKYGYIDPLHLGQSMECIISGSDVKDWVVLTKAVVLELWLNSQATYLRPVKVAANWESKGKKGTNHALHSATDPQN
jgi:asparagine synthase (glutamine-hydrolysing)